MARIGWKKKIGYRVRASICTSLSSKVSGGQRAIRRNKCFLPSCLRVCPFVVGKERADEEETESETRIYLSRVERAARPRIERLE